MIDVQPVNFLKIVMNEVDKRISRERAKEQGFYDRRFRTKVIPNKKKLYKKEDYRKFNDEFNKEN